MLNFGTIIGDFLSGTTAAYFGFIAFESVLNTVIAGLAGIPGGFLGGCLWHKAKIKLNKQP